MISKSTRAKRRKNKLYYQMLAGIKVVLIDHRNGRRFYLISRPVTSNQSIHLEANGAQQLKRQYRNMIEQCRTLAVSAASQ